MNTYEHPTKLLTYGILPKVMLFACTVMPFATIAIPSYFENWNTATRMFYYNCMMHFFQY